MTPNVIFNERTAFGDDLALLVLHQNLNIAE